MKQLKLYVCITNKLPQTCRSVSCRTIVFRLSRLELEENPSMDMREMLKIILNNLLKREELWNLT